MFFGRYVSHEDWWIAICTYEWTGIYYLQWQQRRIFHLNNISKNTWLFWNTNVSSAEPFISCRWILCRTTLKYSLLLWEVMHKLISFHFPFLKLLSKESVPTFKKQIFCSKTAALRGLPGKAPPTPWTKKFQSYCCMTCSPPSRAGLIMYLEGEVTEDLFNRSLGAC